MEASIWNDEFKTLLVGTCISHSKTYLHNTFDVAMSLRIVNWSQFGRSLTMLIVALEDTAGTFTLASDDSSHIVQLYDDNKWTSE